MNSSPYMHQESNGAYMQNVMFDTHENVKQLLSVGFTEDQAEMQTKIIGNLVDDQLVTRYDLGKLELSIEEIKRDIETLRLSTKQDIEALKLSTSRDIEALKLSTSRDIEALKLSTSRDIKELRRDIKESASNLKHDLTLRLGGMLTFAVTVVVLLSKISFGF